MPFLVKIGFARRNGNRHKEKLSKSWSKTHKKGETSCRVLREDAARREAEEAIGWKLEIWKTLLKQKRRSIHNQKRG